MKAIPDLARQRALLDPAKTAFEEVETGRRFSFAEIDAAAGRLARLIGHLGLAEGDRVAVLCHNGAAFFTLLIACARAGAILVPLNWRQTVAELAPILAGSGARLLVHDAAHDDLAAALTETGPRRLSFEALEVLADGLAAEPGSAPPAPWPTDRIWYLLYTSGTTGRPKAVIQTVGMALANTVNVQQATQLTERDVTLNFLPLFHTAGINLHALPVFFNGGTSLILPRFDLDAAMRLIGERRLTLIFAVPTVYQAIADHPDFDRVDLAHVRHWGCGGAPLSAALIRRFLARGVRVCNGMGMTETGPTAFLMDPAHAADKIGSVGKPQILAEVRLVDRDGRDVAPGEAGEILFRGPAVTPGYFGDPQATAAAFAPGGWLRSGDIGRRDRDGYYYVVGRIKEMYISGGENVYPAEVEAVLDGHPAVLESAVIGVADERWGEVGHAVVRLRPGASLEAEALRAYARERLAGYKVPKHVSVADDFPRTASGKVQKHLIARRLSVDLAGAGPGAGRGDA